MSVKKYYSLGREKLFPICRSITGNGVRKTLGIIKKEFPKLKIFSESSGTKVFDWNIPPEWNIKDAYILDKNNKKIVNFKNNNLHLVGYSVPINKFFTITIESSEELKDVLEFDNVSISDLSSISNFSQNNPEEYVVKKLPEGKRGIRLATTKRILEN